MATGTTSSKELNPDASILGPRAARLARGPDISQLRQPIKTSISGTRQVIHALETATGDVKKFLLDEINLMYECKICQSVFRSLANLISHKRTFCKAKYDSVQHMYQDKEGTESANMQTVIIEAEPVECVASAEACHDLTSYSPSEELAKTAGILADLQSRRRGMVKYVGLPTHRLVAPGRLPLDEVIEGLNAKLEGAENTLSKMRKNYEAPRPEATMHLEPMFETRSAFQQSWRYSEGGETMGQTYRAWQQAEEDNRRIKVGPRGEVMTNDATVKLVTGPDGHTYSVRVPVDDDSRGASFAPTEEGANIKYPCPHCKRSFLAVKKVIQHMVSVHDVELEVAKKLRTSIKNSGTVAESKPRNVRINDTNCRPVKPVQVKVQNLTMHFNGKMNLCEQLATDQATVCPIMKSRVSDSTKVEGKDALQAEQVNKFVASRQSEEAGESPLPGDVEAKIMEQVNRRRVQCKTCEKKFSRSLLVRNHVASVHLGLCRWRCEVCDHGCWSRQAALEHVATKHRLTDVAKAVKEQPKSVYFKEYLPEPEVIDIATEGEESTENPSNISEKTTENGDSGKMDTEEIVERCIVGVIINENNGSNGLPTPEAPEVHESGGEDVLATDTINVDGETALGSSDGAVNATRGRGGPTKGRSRGGARGRRGRRRGTSNRSSNSSNISTNKRSREQSSDSEDDFEVILNMPGEKMRKVEEGDTSEETLPDSNLRLERDGNEEPQVPKLLIKFAGPNNTSPTVNKVHRFFNLSTTTSMVGGPQLFEGGTFEDFTEVCTKMGERI